MSLGAVFPTNKYGEKGLFYIGSQVEKSYYGDGFYLFGQATISSTFSSEFAKYTYLETLVSTFIQLSDNLTVAARFLQQSSWNYPRMRQLILDDMRGVRGYGIQGMAGDNRLISNIELR